MKTFIQFITEMAFKSKAAAQKASNREKEIAAAKGFRKTLNDKVKENKGPIMITGKGYTKATVTGHLERIKESPKADVIVRGVEKKHNLHFSFKNGTNMSHINHFGGVSSIIKNETHPGHGTIKEFKTRLQKNFTKYGPIGGASKKDGGDGGRVQPKGHQFEWDVKSTKENPKRQRVTRVGYMLDTSKKKDGTPNNPAHHQMVMESLYGKDYGSKEKGRNNVHAIIQGHAAGTNGGVNEIDLKPIKGKKGHYKIKGANVWHNGELPTAGGHQHFAIFAKHEGPRTDDRDQMHGHPRRADLGVGVGLNGYHPYKGTMQEGPQFKRHPRGSGGSKVTIHHVDGVNSRAVHWLNPESVPHELGGHKK